MSLKALTIPKLPEGKHHDGDGLILVKGARKSSWVLRLQIDGKRVERGLGSLDSLSLAQAREKADDLRRQLKRGEVRPDQVKKGKIQKRDDTVPTFARALDEAFNALSPGWRSGKHVAAFKDSLTTHCVPKLGKTPVNDIHPTDVADCLRSIWLDKPTMAAKVLIRVGQVMNYCHARGWVDQPLNTSAVRQLLPRTRHRDNHFASLPYQELPAFMLRLRDGFSVSRLGLEFVILSACRSGEVRLMKWDELSPDWKAGSDPVWTIPADRMKGGVQHRVPLTPAMVEVLRKCELLRRGDYVFPGQSGRAPMSDMAMRKLVADMGEGWVPHGSRTSFKTWAVECQPDIANEISEQALAHVTGSAVERAYRRQAQDFASRRRLMVAWAEFLA